MVRPAASLGLQAPTTRALYNRACQRLVHRRCEPQLGVAEAERPGIPTGGTTPNPLAESVSTSAIRPLLETYRQGMHA